jgi:predicted short-subunit dehydrogenase-like oxidoreductase (DUF2520 family)
LDKIKNIVLIGAGNVATQLAFALEKAGSQILQVYSRSTNSAETLANDLYTDFTTDVKNIMSGADLYIVSVSDDAVKPLTNDLFFGDKLVVHTSGSLSIDEVKPMSMNYGVFYPLQTFSKTRKANFETIPICIEANNVETEKLLMDLANSISGKVLKVNSEKRKLFHLAAVFACNFPNFMYATAEQILKDSNLDFDLLRPLISETAAKVQTMTPAEAQTGPAKRGDEDIINQHLDLLNEFPGYKEIYQLISSEIQKNK